MWTPIRGDRGDRYRRKGIKVWQKEGRFSKLGLVGHQFPKYIIGYSTLPYVQWCVIVITHPKIRHSLNQQSIDQSFFAQSNNQSASHLRGKGEKIRR